MITQLIYHHSVALDKKGRLVRDDVKAAEPLECIVHVNGPQYIILSDIYNKAQVGIIKVLCETISHYANI